MNFVKSFERHISLIKTRFESPETWKYSVTKHKCARVSMMRGTRVVPRTIAIGRATRWRSFLSLKQSASVSSAAELRIKDEPGGVRKMRNGGQTAQQTAVMTPPHLNGSAQFISGGYVTTGYLPRQSWTQFQAVPQHPTRSGGRPMSLPPPPPSSRRDTGQRPCNGGPANTKNTSLPVPRSVTHRSTTPSVSSKFPQALSKEMPFNFGFSWAERSLSKKSLLKKRWWQIIHKSFGRKRGLQIEIQIVSRSVDRWWI